MFGNTEIITKSELLQWIRASVKEGTNIFSRGYQGNVYLYEDKSQRLILKASIGRGLGKVVRLAMLRNEYRAYSRLGEMQGIPRCHGLLDGRYLMLEYVDGAPIRSAEITDRSTFFEALLNLIKELHKAGIAHTDLKRKDNILVVEGKLPCVIDFGVAIVRKPGFAPLNHYLYRFSRQFDYNAWVKLKYDGEYEIVTEEDRKYYKRTLIERASGRIKDAYLILKKAIMR